MGHDFLRIRGVKYLTYGPMGKSQMSMRKPIKLSTTFLVFFPNHLFLPECGWVSYCMEWEEYGQPNSNWAETRFWKTCSDFLSKKKMPKNVFHSAMHSRFLVSSRFGSSWSFSCVFSIQVLAVGFIFSHGLKVFFVIPGPGLSSSRFWSCWLFGDVFFPAVSCAHW